MCFCYDIIPANLLPTVIVNCHKRAYPGEKSRGITFSVYYTMCLCYDIIPANLLPTVIVNCHKRAYPGERSQEINIVMCAKMALIHKIYHLLFSDFMLNHAQLCYKIT